MITMSSTPKSLSHRERIYIVSDIILKLVEYGEMNQTALMSFCGLNINKHRPILERMEDTGLIMKMDRLVGKKSVTIYKSSLKGYEFCKNILEPYEKMFPRSRQPPIKEQSSYHIPSSILDVSQANLLNIQV
jgi:predicted transcriptional regulator